MAIDYPWKADPAVWCGGTLAGLTLWCQDKVPGDLQTDTYPELVPLTRVISTTIGRELDDGDGHALEEIWWNGDLFYRPGPASMGRSRFEGVLVTGLDANPPYTPVRTVLRANATTKTDASGAVVDRLHSWLQLEGSLFSDGWAEGVTLHPGAPSFDSKKPGNPWEAVGTGFDDDTGAAYKWWVMLTPTYRCLPAAGLRSSPTP
jgi:hypothetical protein